MTTVATREAGKCSPWLGSSILLKREHQFLENSSPVILPHSFLLREVGVMTPVLPTCQGIGDLNTVPAGQGLNSHLHQ